MNTQIDASISKYAQNGIDIKILENEKETVKVLISQNRLYNGYILNQKQLVERVKKIFENTGFKVKVIPSVFSLDVKGINIEWIEKKCNEFGLKRNDIVKQMAIDKSTLSLYLSGDRKMNKSVKAGFYYYFLTYELNKDFRV